MPSEKYEEMQKRMKECLIRMGGHLDSIEKMLDILEETYESASPEEKKQIEGMSDELDGIFDALEEGLRDEN